MTILVYDGEDWDRLVEKASCEARITAKEHLHTGWRMGHTSNGDPLAVITIDHVDSVFPPILDTSETVGEGFVSIQVLLVPDRYVE